MGEVDGNVLISYKAGLNEKDMVNKKSANLVTVSDENGKIMFDGMPFNSVKELLQFCDEKGAVIKTVERDKSKEWSDELNMLEFDVRVGSSTLPWIAKKLIAQRDDFWNNPSFYK